MNKFLKTCLALLIAVNLCGIGVGLFVQANLGSDSFTILQEGLSVTFDITLGTASYVFVGVTILIALIINCKDLGWTTFAYGLTVGYFIDFYNNLFVGMGISEMHMGIRFLCVCIGQLAFVITYSILIKYRNGMNQVDAIAYGIERITKLSYKVIRTGVDVVFIVVGVLLGGVVGIGSIIAMFTTGIGIDICLKAMDKIGL